MAVSRALYDEYVSGLDMQYAEACQMLADYIDSLDWDVGYEEAKALRDQVISYAYSLIEVYGGNASVLAADFYGQAAAEAGKAILEPLLGNLPRYESVAKSIRYAARVLWGGKRDVDTFRAYALSSLKRYIKQCGDRTMEVNAKRDGKKHGVRWARVPRGPETCAFCIMVASRGFVYASEDSAAFFGHSHEHCDCDIVCGFDGEGLEGYDEQFYKDWYYANVVYDAYGHVNTAETRRALARSVYHAYGDHNRAVARAWYARNAEEERARAAKYRAEHRDEINAKKRKKRAADKAKRTAEEEQERRRRFVDAYNQATQQQRELGI